MATIYDSVSESVSESVGEVVGKRNVPELKKIVAVWGIYFGGLLLLRFVTHGIGSVIDWGTLSLLLGGAVGMLMPVIDRLVYVYYLKPEDKLSVLVRSTIAEKKYVSAVKLMYERKREQVHLSMENVMFMGVWVVLTFFLVTSSPSMFAKGMVLGIGLEMILGIKEDWKDKAYLIDRLFWPLKKKLGEDELKAVVAVFVGLFGLASVLV